MRVLDLFCGMGGWSIGFHRKGFECTGLDIVDVGYPYQLIQMDIRDFHAEYHDYDIVLASPPCKDFSELSFLRAAKAQSSKPNPEKGMELVSHTIRIIKEIDPDIWVLENVRFSVKWISKVLGQPKFSYRPWYLWGKFPAFMLQQSNLGNKKIRSGPDGRLNSDVKWDPLISWKRAKIPLPLSIALASAVEEQMLAPLIR